VLFSWTIGAMNLINGHKKGRTYVGPTQCAEKIKSCFKKPREAWQAKLLGDYG
jgi:hypothetical protein